MSAISVLGREVVVTVEGRPWKIARIEVGILDQFIDWVKTQLPPCEPFAGFDKIIPHLPAEEAMKLIAEEFGGEFVSLLMLQAHQPEATLNDAMRVFKQVGSAGLAQLLAEARGEFRQGKAEAPAAEASGPTGAISAGA